MRTLSHLYHLHVEDYVSSSLRYNKADNEAFSHSWNTQQQLWSRQQKDQYQQSLDQREDNGPLVQLPTPRPMPGDCHVQAFIQKHVKPYLGDASFLAPPTKRTLASWEYCETLMQQEQEKGILDVDVQTASTITSHGPGYVLSKEMDLIHGLQTDAPLKRACKPRGGFQSVSAAMKCYGYQPDPMMEAIYGSQGPVETHHKFVMNTYTPEMK